MTELKSPQNPRVQRAIKYLEQLQFGDHVELACLLASIDRDFLCRLEVVFAQAVAASCPTEEARPQT